MVSPRSMQCNVHGNSLSHGTLEDEKHRLTNRFRLPSDITEAEIVDYVDDLAFMISFAHSLLVDARKKLVQSGKQTNTQLPSTLLPWSPWIPWSSSRLGPVDDHDNNGNFDDDEDMMPIQPPPPSDHPAQLLEWDEAPNAQEADAPKAWTYPSTVPMHKLESLHDMLPRGVRPSIDDPAHRLHISTDDAPGADGTPAFLLHIPAFAMIEMEAQRRAASIGIFGNPICGSFRCRRAAWRRAA